MPTYGTIGELEESLQRAVLAERTVEHREDDVDVLRRVRVDDDVYGSPSSEHAISGVRVPAAPTVRRA